MSAPFFFHWYASGAVPEAPTEKLAAAPSHSVAPAGCVLIAGAVFTASAATMLITEAQPLLTRTE